MSGDQAGGNSGKAGRAHSHRGTVGGSLNPAGFKKGAHNPAEAGQISPDELLALIGQANATAGELLKVQELLGGRLLVGDCSNLPLESLDFTDVDLSSAYIATYKKHMVKGAPAKTPGGWEK